MVISLIIFRSSKKIVVMPSCVYRDIGIYIFATVYILIVSAFGEITTAISVGLLLIYAALVVIVIIQDYIAARNILGKEASSLKGNTIDSSDSVDKVNQTPEEKKHRMRTLARKFRYHLTVMTIATKMVTLAKFKYRQEQHEVKFVERSLFDKFVYIVDFPSDIIRKLTMPPCEPEHFHKTWLVLWPFPGMFLLTWTFFSTFSMTWVYVLVPICIILMCFFFFTCPEQGVPKYLAAIEILGLLMSVIWTYIMSTILVDLLQMWTIFTGISATYMGLTIIAVGSALPDAVTTLALATQGYGDMAITGNYSSQCFGFLVGFGLSMTKKTLTSGTQYFSIWDFDSLTSSTLDVLVILVMLLVLAVSFLYGILRNFHFDKILATILIGIYSIFLLTATVMAVIILINGAE